MTPKFRSITVGDIRLTSEDRAAVLRVLENNRLSYGPVTQEFERRFAALHDSRFAVFSNSGTSALHVALAALKEKYGWNDGDEVVVPATTFVATVNTIIHNNLTPVFVDVDARTYNLDHRLIEQHITSRTRAILPVHLLGLPASMGAIMNIARGRKLRVIEDSAECMFAKHNGRTVGSFGDIGCFSTYIAHYIVTGIGGLNTTSDPELAVMLRSLVNHGRDSIYLSIDDDDNKSPEQLKEIMARRFRFVRLGHSFRATEMEAALGVSQLNRWQSIVAARQHTATEYHRGLSDLWERLQLPYTPPDRTHSYMMFGLVCKEEGEKAALTQYLEQHGIETRDMLPLVRQPIYQRLYGPLEARLPVARWLDDNAFYIGCHQYITTEDVRYVVETFHEFYRR